MPVPVLYSDDAILVIDKPAGLLSIQDGYNLSLATVKTELEPLYGRLWVVHRLDRLTSGVMLLARSAEAHRTLNLAFDQHLPVKLYQAALAGNPPWESISLTHPLRINGDRNHRTVIDPVRGKPARTDVSLLERFMYASFVSIRLYTGYTHQIRSHLAHAGFPLCGDPLYRSKIPAVSSTNPTNLPTPPGLMLHAGSLSLPHPLTGQELTFCAPLPAAFQAYLEILRQSIN